MISGLYALCLWTSTDGCVFVKAYQTMPGRQIVTCQNPYVPSVFHTAIHRTILTADALQLAPQPSSLNCYYLLVEMRVSKRKVALIAIMFL